MREIKFRVWNNVENKMEYPDIIGFHTESFSWTHSRSYFHNCQDWDNEDGFISNPVLEQFTGLHDKNGVEIYEGDIVLYVNDICPALVIFNNGSFQTECPFTKDLGDLVKNKVQIIGNIHQNPNSLK